MIELVKYATGGFWIFVGCITILALILQAITQVVVRFLRVLVLMKHGYPPEYCDVDGDFKEENSTNEEDL